MATYYLDYVNGNNANNGSSWAQAWKTITDGPTAARIAPGDIIRIAKSPDPTAIGDATWTNLSKTVTLAGALTANIELCETAWTASANVTATTSTTRKQGSYSTSLTIATAFTTGKIAYKAFTETDFSGYQQVSFWIRTTVAIAAGVLTVRLCSDNAGVTTVNTIAVPAIPKTAQWQVVTVDTGGALGSSIQSIALYAEIDPGTPTILLDNILACKASSAPDSLTLSSLISKNGAAQDGTEGFYGIQSINGTTVLLDNHTNTAAADGRGYSGVTETVTTYKRETIKTTVASSFTTVVQEVQDSGSLAEGNIEFQGGYNTNTSIQDGETYFDGQNSSGYGIQLSSKSYVTLNFLNVIRYYYGFHIFLSNNNSIITLSNANNNYSCGCYIYSCNNNIITTLANANNNGSFGFYIQNCNNNTITTLANVNNNMELGCYIYSCNNNIITTLAHANNNESNGVEFTHSHNNTITTLANVNNNMELGCYFNTSHNNIITTLSNANNNGSFGFYFGYSSNNIIKSLSTIGNVSAGFGAIGGTTNYIRNSLIAEATEVSILPVFANTRVYSYKHNQITDNHWIFTDGGTINSQTATRHTASGIAWKLAITSSNRSSIYPLKLKIAEVAVNANALVTVKAWFKKDHATNIVAKLVCPGSQLTGIQEDVTTTKADDTDWEELTISFTPTEAGVIEIEAWAYYVSGNSNAYVDDFSVAQE